MTAIAPLSRLHQYLQYRKVFRTHRDITAYRVVRDHPERCEGPVSLHMRAIPGGPLLCRPGTMDAITLWDAFFTGYHLPTFELREPRVIVDAGANAGYTAASLAATYPTAAVIAVEMDPSNAMICERNLEQFGSRCQVVQAAVWDVTGTITYAGGNVHNYAITSVGGASTREAHTVTIDQLLERFSLHQIDYLKMDIEGAEARVLQSPHGWIDRVRSLSLEVHPPATMDQCRERLVGCGFTCDEHPHHPSGLVARRPDAVERHG